MSLILYAHSFRDTGNRAHIQMSSFVISIAPEGHVETSIASIICSKVLMSLYTRLELA
jgi:hypothetical protein